jgi:hypothetical protein
MQVATVVVVVKTQKREIEPIAQPHRLRARGLLHLHYDVILALCPQHAHIGSFRPHMQPSAYVVLVS